MDERYDIPDGTHKVEIDSAEKVVKPDHKAILFKLRPLAAYEGLIFHYQIMTPKGKLTQTMIKNARDNISRCFGVIFHQTRSPMKNFRPC